VQAVRLKIQLEPLLAELEHHHAEQGGEAEAEQEFEHR
jgi:hypothetical protein